MSVTRTARPNPVRRVEPFNIFIWQGTDKRGKVMKGEQQPKNANGLRGELRRQGIQPKTFKPESKPLFGGARKTISPRKIAVFSRQIATMMKSGVPIVGAM